ncbi:MAG TPA: DUF1579 domain-containing protein [Caldimonas sp.]|jgi:hypothetical protein|nr:DUF1579 domain-containing protein [Caldimonas sp.]
MSPTSDAAFASRRGVLLLAARLLGGAAPASLALGAGIPHLTETPMNELSSERDFDFLAGRWRVLHRRLRERLAGDDRWQEFEGSCTMAPVLGGLGNVDDNVVDLPGGAYRAVSIRSFDPATRRWAIWWLDGRDPHRIDVPVVGAFAAGVGTFHADETFKGRPIRVRFRWTDTTTPSPRWEQAFSPDAGATWETNWMMRFVRVP